jgi:hypothetical protein
MAKKLRCKNWTIRGVIEIELHPNNMNRENVFFLSKSWKPFIHTLKE